MMNREKKLEQALLSLPRRKEKISGQTFSYLKLEDVLAVFSALGPTPKATKTEPVAWQRRKRYSMNGSAPQWEYSSASEAAGHFEREEGYEYRPLYTSPVAALEVAQQETTKCASPE